MWGCILYLQFLFWGFLCSAFVEICPAFLTEVSLLYTSTQESEECLSSDCSPALTPETGWEAGQTELIPPAALL